jgi:hypothetical protein
MPFGAVFAHVLPDSFFNKKFRVIIKTLFHLSIRLSKELTVPLFLEFSKGKSQEDNN